MPVDRSAILTDAHARCRWARAQVVRVSGKLDPYRVTFAWCLRAAWRAAADAVRQAISLAALSALEEIEDLQPDNIPARVDALRAYANTLPLVSDGYRKIMADADDLAAAARCVLITSGDHHHVAAR